jgi:hypothetical protein
MMRDDFSAAELVLAWTEPRYSTDLVPAGLVVGPADHDEQQRGVVSIVSAGRTRPDQTNLYWARVQLRCIAPSLDEADRIGWHMHALFYDQGRAVVTQPSTGVAYLIHRSRVAAGPSHHFDTPGTWEALLFIEVGIQLDPAQ